MNKIRTCILCPALLVVTALALLVAAKVMADGNIDPARRFAWSTATGWINFSPAHGGVAVYDDHLEGYAWAENTGWVHFKPDTYNVAVLPGVYISRQSGPWTSGATWGSATTPTARDSVTVTAGTTVTIDSDAHCYRLFVEPGGVLVIPDGVALSVETELANNGTLRQTVGSLPAGVTTRFLHIQNQAQALDLYQGVDITPQDAMGPVTVRIRGHRQCTSVAGETVNRCFDIAATGNATVTFHYLESERNGLDAPAMNVWRWAGSQPMLPAGDYVLSRDDVGPDYSVTVGDVSSFSPFVLRPGVPTAVTLRKLGVGTTHLLPLGGMLGVLVLGAAAVILKRKK